MSNNSSELMYIKCAYCGAWVDVKPGRMHTVSHGSCRACFEREMHKLDADTTTPDTSGEPR